MMVQTWPFLDQGRAVAMLKSHREKVTLPSSSVCSRMLAGFMSRWANPTACMLEMPRAKDSASVCMIMTGMGFFTM